MTKTTKTLTTIVIILFGGIFSFLGVQQYQKYQKAEQEKLVYAEKRQKAIEVSKELISVSKAFDNKLINIDWMTGKGNYSQNSNIVFAQNTLQFLENHPENTEPNEARKIFIIMLERYIYLIPVLQDNLKAMENIDANQEALKTASSCSNKKDCNYYLDTLFLIKYSNDIYNYNIKAKINYTWPEGCKTAEEANQLRDQFYTSYTQTESTLKTFNDLVSKSTWITTSASSTNTPTPTISLVLDKAFSHFKMQQQLYKAYDNNFLLSACKDFSESTKEITSFNQYLLKYTQTYQNINNKVIQKEFPGCTNNQTLCYQNANKELKEALNKDTTQN